MPPEKKPPRLLQLTSPMMRGYDVKNLQRRLEKLGYAVTIIDGIFGNELDEAVKSFQQNHQLTADGIVGKNTYYALDQAEQEPPSKPLQEASPPTSQPDHITQPEPPKQETTQPPPSTPATVGIQPLRTSLLAATAYAGLKLTRGTDQNNATRDLQRNLRALGYLRAGIDGAFGHGTENAIRALQYDLLHNDGTDSQQGEDAPVAIRNHNQNRVTEITGIADDNTVACIQDLLNDSNFPLLPYSDNPTADNDRIHEQIAQMQSNQIPIPFLVAILHQESNFQHFKVPRRNDEDAYIVVGCDTNDSTHPYRITSRGYGAGQYTLFHHPPRQEEVEQFMLEVSGNVKRAKDELREKFDHFVIGNTPATKADDRIAEVGDGPLRLCKYNTNDPRYLTDCVACLQTAGSQTIEAGTTPYHPNTNRKFEPTQYHRQTQLVNIPIRANIECDWPYAVRRYNGSGPNSYWYQAELLEKVLEIKPA